MKTAALYFMTLLTVSSAWAQVADSSVTVPPLPAGPLLKRAPELSRWVVTYSTRVASKNEATAPGQGEGAAGGETAKTKVLQRVETTKSGPIFHVVTSRENGKRFEQWCKGDVQIFVWPDWKEPMFSGSDDRLNPLRLDFSKTDFPGCEWISSKSYKGITKVQGRDCIAFEDNLVVAAIKDPVMPLSPADAAIGEQQVRVSAYVDLETRLPVMLLDGGQILTFQFGPPPEPMLSLPAGIQAVIDSRDNAIRQLTSMPPRPY